MRSSVFISGAILAILQAIPSSALPAADAKSAQGPIPGYRIEDITWQVKARPDGPTMNVTGTIQQVFDALDKANPNFRHDFGIANKSVLPATAESSSSYEVEKVVCTGFDYARKDATQDGIKHLNSVPGAPANGPGPGNCGRVSCSYDSAIYWCNDNPEVKSLDSYSSIGWAAQFTLDSKDKACKDIWGETPVDDGVKGQVFVEGNWNVVVRKDDC
ncbi:hypothetical protein SMACR_04238 [Sordaria macrospora]|uniref:WGS project CABT00000000 data, contig 2.19 n=2 Tax=Sordaria macrospora TaxID=5147 RepID=F7W195_SORMK|nr:uncharacterized protein SMAC_04238 [Sordaria macrospora k-hell]KAA8631868.1 hypothetical protein SMACR_04238 [Sordaria macrospora]KAH7626404.1 hypothetical protein B0T09DRAFT_411944 [Sordaria sp. MPI-SDFR-AT-0083]WPJ58044.1 hypothetical protein SMAC4_04238 [Sordaria macrospora]CCC04870.1 unnamed protein product [Sordaria macrospora k-hell]